MIETGSPDMGQKGSDSSVRRADDMNQALDNMIHASNEMIDPSDEHARQSPRPSSSQLAQARRFVLMLIVFVVSSQSCLAQALTFEVNSLAKRRNSGAISLDFNLIKRQPGILKGRLSLTLTQYSVVVSDYTSDELTLSAGVTRMRIMLPSLGDQDIYTGDLSLQVDFRAGDRTISLGSPAVRVATREERIFRVLYVTDDERVNFKKIKAIESLSFQQFWSPNGRDSSQTAQSQEWNRKLKENRKLRNNIKLLKPDSTSPTIFTTSEHALADDLTNLPLWYCNYNVVVLFSDAFENMRSSQLDALETWVKAGGSLCIEPMAVLDDFHIEFLERLKSANGDTEEVALTTDGRFLPLASGSFESFRLDLGRVVLLYRSTKIGAENAFGAQDEAWRNEAVPFLWNFRKDQIQDVKSSGLWDWSKVQKNSGYGSATFPLTPIPIQSRSQLFNQLMPDEVKIVPLHYIAFILLFYVVTIGPLDYFVLGFLKLRRFTWVTFPLATLAFTLFTVWLSNDFLSSAVERSFVSVIDVGDDGKIVRENRFELLYTGSTHDVTTSLSRSLFTPLNTDELSYDVRNRFRESAQSKAIIPRLSGRPPQSVKAVQTMPQWTPQLNRILTLKTKDETAIQHAKKFNWKKQWNLTTGAEQSKLRQAVYDAFGRDARVSVFSSGGGAMVETYSVFFQQITVRPQQGLFGIVSKMAPHGGRDFEDLTLLDHSNRDEYVIMIDVPHEDGMYVLRKHYRKQPAK